MEVRVEVPVVQQVIKEVETIVEKEVFIDRVKEVVKTIEKPVESIVEKLIYVDKIIEKPI